MERDELHGALSRRPARRALEHAPPRRKPARALRHAVPGGCEGVIVAASDYLKVLPDAIDAWLPRRLLSLGTDGFGRSESRAAARLLRGRRACRHVATLVERSRGGRWRRRSWQQAIEDLGINPEKANPQESPRRSSRAREDLHHGWISHSRTGREHRRWRHGPRSGQGWRHRRRTISRSSSSRPTRRPSKCPHRSPARSRS